MTLPTSPPTQPRDPTEIELLLQFVHERDHRGPRCDYNLRNLTQPVCPECREQLVLKVGLHKLTVHWLMLTAAPGIFSGIAALLLLVPIVVVPIRGGGFPPWFIYATDVFGWLSGISVLVLMLHRHRFLRQPDHVQRNWAIGSWLLHLAAFIGLMVCMFS